jgi:hypothetical protein
LERRNPKSTAAARAVVALIGLWILTGALFKLLLGTPADLPGVFRELPVPLDLAYKLAIAIELVTAATAFLRPRMGWILAGLALLCFDLVLGAAIADGEASCGCFGATIEVAPETMLAIDSSLLLLLALVRPWSAWRGAPGRVGLALPWLGALGALLAALPWMLDRRAAPPPRARAAVDPVAPAGAGSPPRIAGSPAPSALDTAPALLRPYAVFEPRRWVGQEIGATELAKWIDVYALPLDATWIVYRYTCEHCQAHLERLSAEYDGVTPLGLVRLAETKDTDHNRLVRVLPAGPNVVHATAPDTVQYVVTTPVELVLEAGVVSSAREGTEVAGPAGSAH